MGTLAVVGPAQLASALIGEGATDLSVSELEADIRGDPYLYWPDYLWACERHDVPPLSRGTWADLCFP